MIRAKEKEVEKMEQNGLALIQNKKEEVSGVVMSTLRELKQTWANLDHMVITACRDLTLRPRLPPHVHMCHGFWFS